MAEAPVRSTCGRIAVWVLGLTFALLVLLVLLGSVPSHAWPWILSAVAVLLALGSILAVLRRSRE